MNVGNFIWQLSTTTGLSDFTLTTNDSFVEFVDEFGTGSSNKFFYGIHNREAVQWEVGIGYMLDATTLVRDSVLRSSNANALVNFTSGLKDVTCDVPAYLQAQLALIGTMAFEDALDYYTKVATDVLLANKSDVGHTHVSADITDLSTSTVPEGSNQYFTNERAQDAVAAALISSLTISFSYNDLSNEIFAIVNTDSINDTHIDWGHGVNQVNAYDVPVAILGNPTYKNLQDFINVTFSPGLISGGVITNAGGGNVNVSSGTGIIRIADDDVSELKFFDFAAASGIAIPSNSIRYIGVEYNSGSPQIISKTTDDWNYDIEFPFGTVVHENGMIYIINRPWKTGDSLTNIIERLDSEAYITRDNRVGGLTLGETGVRNITITAGQMLTRLEEFPIPANDTSGSDTFTAYYRDGLGDWTLVASQTQYDNAFYDNGSGTLAALTAGYYTSQWVFLTVNNKILVLYGEAEYATPTELVEQDFPPSSVPVRVSDMAILIGRIVIQQGASSAERIDSAFNKFFTPSVASDHGNLAGLSDDDHLQYFTTGRADTWLGTKSTDDLAEGTNLYHTSERVDDRVNALIQDAGGIVKSYNDAGDALTLNTAFATRLLHIQDQKAQNTDGGSFTSGAWRTRDLNTILTNEISGASLGSNQITLPAGTYFAMWEAPAWHATGTNEHQTRLQDITNTATLLLGKGQSIRMGGQSIGSGRFTLSGSATIELQHQISATQNTTGFGEAANFTTEIYSSIKIWKL